MTSMRSRSSARPTRAASLLARILVTHILHQIDDEAFVPASEDHALEAWGILPDLELAAGRGGDVGQDEAAALERGWLRGEQIEIVSRSVAQVEAGERGSAGEEETALALEERIEDVALERGQLARSRGGHGGASLRSGSSRMRSAARGGAAVARGRARLRLDGRTPRCRCRALHGASLQGAGRAAGCRARRARRAARRWIRLRPRGSTAATRPAPCRS